MIAIIDYGVGNLFSLRASLEKIGAEAVVTGDADIIKSAGKLILPGVGAFEDAAKKLFSSGLADVIIKEAQSGKPIMGICLGMQLLFDTSFEFGCHKGLGLIKGEIKPLSGYIDSNLKIPHIGWNALDIVKPDCPILKYSKSGDCVYFVHSFYADGCDNFVSAYAEYSKPVTAAVQKDNVFGCQFHPEKSGESGLKILKAFSEI